MQKALRDNVGYIFLGVIVVYFVLTFSLPVSRLLLEHYHLSLLGLRLIQLTYTIPQALIWSMAFYSFYFIHKYAQSIIKDKDGKAMNYISIGIAVLAFGGPITNIVSSSLNAIAAHHIHLIPTVTITSNYLSLCEGVAAFVLIGLGARGLADTVKANISYQNLQIVALLLTISGSVFCYLIFHSLPNSLKLGLNGRPTYYLPDWLILTTIVIPYIMVWIYGALAALHTQAYYVKVKGTIYKSSLKFMTLGMGFIIFSYIVLQYLTTLTSKLVGWKLSSLLLIIYPLIALVSVGYILMALGAKKLRKIEES